MSVAFGAWGTRSRASGWSAASFALAAIGVALATWVILGSDSDPGHVRWWLVGAPIVVTAIPLVLPERGVRLGAAIVLGAWCVLASLSIGMLLVPAWVVAALAVRESR